MKKIILSAAALFAFGFANAQDATTSTEGGKGFSNGDIFISGSLGFSSQSTGDVKTNTFTISPKVGFFLSDNIAIGGQIGYTSTKDEDGVSEDIKTNTFSVGAFGRYYATPASDFSFFAELGANYMTSKMEQGSAEAKSNGFGIALSPGLSYFIGSNWALEASIGALSYNTEKPDFDGAESTDTFGLNLNLTNVNVGVVYKF
ncbi:MAG: porin family protein [Flavobacterium sp.]|nr:MAG: porin family protein [Flavobacterium sp.]